MFLLTLDDSWTLGSSISGWIVELGRVPNLLPKTMNWGRNLRRWSRTIPLFLKMSRDSKQLPMLHYWWGCCWIWCLFRIVVILQNKQAPSTRSWRKPRKFLTRQLRSRLPISSVFLLLSSHALAVKTPSSVPFFNSRPGKSMGPLVHKVQTNVKRCKQTKGSEK